MACWGQIVGGATKKGRRIWHNIHCGQEEEEKEAAGAWLEGFFWPPRPFLGCAVLSLLLILQAADPLSCKSEVISSLWQWEWFWSLETIRKYFSPSLNIEIENKPRQVQKYPKVYSDCIKFYKINFYCEHIQPATLETLKPETMKFISEALDR